MSDLPVREIVLYKHGVGFFVREGAVEGEDLVLTFRADEINDILKSLTVIDRGGGKANDSRAGPGRNRQGDRGRCRRKSPGSSWPTARGRACW